MIPQIYFGYNAVKERPLVLFQNQYVFLDTEHFRYKEIIEGLKNVGEVFKPSSNPSPTMWVFRVEWSRQAWKVLLELEVKYEQ